MAAAPACIEKVECAHHAYAELRRLAIIWHLVKVYFSPRRGSSDDAVRLEIKVDIAFRSIIQAWMMMTQCASTQEGVILQFWACWISVTTAASD